MPTNDYYNWHYPNYWPASGTAYWPGATTPPQGWQCGRCLLVLAPWVLSCNCQVTVTTTPNANTTITSTDDSGTQA